MSRKKEEIQQNQEKVLLVEGNDDFHFVLNLRDAHKIPKDLFGVFDCRSDEGVLSQLNSSIISSTNPPKVIGIMLDTDKPTGNPSVGARFDSIKGKLKEYNYQFPSAPDPNGTIIDGYEDKPKLGFWLMPNNQVPGMLEDFCAQLIEPETLKYTEEVVYQSKNRGITTFKQVHLSKAIIHTCLAWCDEPGYPLGKAITAKSLSPHKAIATQFTDWLNRLFI